MSNKYSEALEEMRDLADLAQSEAADAAEITQNWNTLGQSDREYMDEEYPEIPKPDREDDDWWDEDQYGDDYEEWENDEPEKPDRDDYDDEEDYDDAVEEYESDHEEWQEKKPDNRDDRYFHEDAFDEAESEWRENESYRSYYEERADNLDTYGDDVRRACDHLQDTIDDLHKAVHANPPNFDLIDTELGHAELQLDKTQREAGYLEEDAEWAYDEITKKLDEIEGYLKDLRSIINDIQDDTKYRIAAHDLQNMHRAYRPVISMLDEWYKGRLSGGKGRFPLGWGMVVRGGNVDEAERRVDKLWDDLADEYDKLLVGFPKFTVTAREWNRIHEKIEAIHDLFDRSVKNIIERAEDLESKEIGADVKLKILDIIESDNRKFVEPLLRELKKVMNTRPI